MGTVGDAYDDAMTESAIGASQIVLTLSSEQRLRRHKAGQSPRTRQSLGVALIVSLEV